MKKPFQLIATAVFSATLLFTSCAKDGAPGPKGADGSSDVTSTTINTASWTLSSTSNEYDAILTVPSITTDVISGGTVQVFLGDGSGNTWAGLPTTIPVSGGDLAYTYLISNGQVEISIIGSSNLTLNNPGAKQFKVVVIPPKS